jgi:hypothetical protein
VERKTGKGNIKIETISFGFKIAEELDFNFLDLNLILDINFILNFMC